MNKLVFLGLGVLASLNVVAQELAFPGAEGFGKYATGGRAIDARGNDTLRVTSLEDCPDNQLQKGTLRWAIRKGGDKPRVIVFDVAGTIYLTHPLSFTHPNVSILGQTAPAGGICIAGYTFKITKSNVIVRYIRFRAGDLPNKSMTSLDVENVKNIMIDHCSMTWSMEENLTMYDCDSTTVQWCVIAEGLYRSKNAKGARSYATQWGGQHATMHHCLIANVNNRAPRFNGVRKASRNPGDHDKYVDNEFINNVIYNWGKPNSLYGGECFEEAGDDAYNRVYMINNYFRPGPTTQKNLKDEPRYFVQASYKNKAGKGLGEWYLSGNHFELNSKWAPDNKLWKNSVLKKVNEDNMYGVLDSLPERAFNTEIGVNKDIVSTRIMMGPTATSNVNTETAEEAFQSVIKGAGARLPKMDEVDARILSEAAGLIDPMFAGKKDGEPERGWGIINSQKDITLIHNDELLQGWPDLTK